MKKVFERPKALKQKPFHFCPGCGHSITHRLVAETIDELGIRDRIIGVPPAGCAVLAYFYFDVDMTEAAHGRAVAVATGIKRCLPDSLVFTYQGDGDLAAIGTAEVVHAANRGERITIIFVNNAVYGMTGGQMAPTTLLGQRTSTSPRGRDANREGHTMKLSELLSTFKGAVYLERGAVNSPKNILRTKKAIKNAFQVQIDGEGFSMVEILSPCPTNWKVTPREACQRIEKEMSDYFPIGIVKDTRKEKRAQ